MSFRAGTGVVDKIEDAKFLKLNKAQQRSTSYLHLIETECVENRAFSEETINCLGRRGSGDLPSIISSRHN
jgi:hypothetical protein